MKNDYSGTPCILNTKISNILVCFSSKKIMCKLLYHPLRLHMWSAHFVITPVGLGVETGRKKECKNWYI